MRAYELLREQAVAPVYLLYAPVMPLDGDTAVLVPEVCCLGHVAEETNLDDARQHLDTSEELRKMPSQVYRREIGAGWRRTVYGSFMISSGKGASMIKLPLSDTTGPALAFAMRRVALGEPIKCKFCRIFLYAKGTTSIGMPCLNCYADSQPLCWQTAGGFQDSRSCPGRQSSCGSPQQERSYDLIRIERMSV